MTSKREKDVNHEIRHLIDAAGYLSAASSSLLEAGYPGSAELVDQRRTAAIQRAKRLATSINPSFWDGWRATFETLEAD